MTAAAGRQAGFNSGRILPRREMGQRALLPKNMREHCAVGGFGWSVSGQPVSWACFWCFGVGVGVGNGVFAKICFLEVPDGVMNLQNITILGKNNP
ncbi:MAG: hypothetical protein RR323_00310 [Raoultibacter sp.]